ncbi:uncharacterized protein [Apostichopus japonicus]|uniref:uncharacterized protein n=1 Tax=Stichopus japonicus TaxID=307972 RepID=UPI003AB80EF4
MEMAKQPPQQQYIQTTQPNQGYQPYPHVVVVQSPAPPQNSGAAIGALVFSIITLICCPGSFLCTIPSCICAIAALNDNSDSARSLTHVSFVATALFYVALVISIVIVIIWWFMFANEALYTYNNYVDANFNHVYNNSFDYSVFN